MAEVTAAAGGSIAFEPPAAVLSLVEVSKSFPGARVLDSVSLDLELGAVHGLVGHNGSGKSTLIKVLAGYHQADSGHVVLDGEVQSFDRLVAEDRVRVLHQDLGIVPALNVVENLCLARGFTSTRLGIISWRAEADRARAALEQLGVAIDVRQPASSLTFAERTFVGLARTLQDWEPRGGLLILDEPTASLTSADVERLMVAVRGVAARGAAVLFVSHKLDEVLVHCRRVTVLHCGRVTARRDVDELDHGSLVDLILGEAAAARGATTAPPTELGDPALTVEGLGGADLAPLSLEVRAGEILGIAGLQGSGREEVAMLLVGGTPRLSGRAKVARRPLRGDPSAAARSGMAIVPADRRRHGVVLSLSVGQNIALGRPRSQGLRIWASRGRDRDRARPWIEQVRLQPPSTETVVGQLSGGNQQKVVLARCLLQVPEVLVLDEPSQGIDVGAKAVIHDQIRDTATRGAAVVVASSDSDELAQLCHRVLVLKDGHVRQELVGQAVTSLAIDRACIQ